MTLNDISKNKIIWRAYNKGLLTEEESLSLMESVSTMPSKGCGGIQVNEKDKDRVIGLLKGYVGVYESNYYPEGFVTDLDLSCYDNYGKFEIEDLNNFIVLLKTLKIEIINIYFMPAIDEKL